MLLKIGAQTQHCSRCSLSQDSTHKFFFGEERNTIRLRFSTYGLPPLQSLDADADTHLYTALSRVQGYQILSDCSLLPTSPLNMRVWTALCEKVLLICLFLFSKLFFFSNLVVFRYSFGSTSSSYLPVLNLAICRWIVKHRIGRCWPTSTRRMLDCWSPRERLRFVNHSLPTPSGAPLRRKYFKPSVHEHECGTLLILN